MGGVRRFSAVPPHLGDFDPVQCGVALWIDVVLESVSSLNRILGHNKDYRRANGDHENR